MHDVPLLTIIWVKKKKVESVIMHLKTRYGDNARMYTQYSATLLSTYYLPL